MKGLIYSPDQFLTLDLVNNHLRIDTPTSEDTNYINSLIYAALLTVSNDINREIYPANEVFDNSSYPDAIPFNGALVVATLLLIGTWYENRESVAVDANAIELPMAYKMLIRPFRILQSSVI